MKLHLTPESISIHIAENSSHYLHVKETLAHSLGRAFWVNDILVNFCTQQEVEKRKAFLTSLYYTCAFSSQSHNAYFLKKLILMAEKPIKLLKKRAKPLHSRKHASLLNPYRILNAQEEESFESIRRKYLDLAKKFHPDRLETSDEIGRKKSTATFQQIQEAYAHIKAEKMGKMVA